MVVTSSYWNQSVRETSRTQTTQGNEKASRLGYTGIYIPSQAYHF